MHSTALVPAWGVSFLAMLIFLGEFFNSAENYYFFKSCQSLKQSKCPTWIRLLAVLMTARMRPSLANTSFLPTRRRQELETKDLKSKILQKLPQQVFHHKEVCQSYS